MIKKLIKIKTMEIIIYYNFFYNNKKEKNSYKYIFINKGYIIVLMDINIYIKKSNHIPINYKLFKFII